MKIAVEGCAHGELEKIYDTIQSIENSENIKIDLLLCCGDFQATRNLEDLQTMAVPKKYQDICTFYKYYSGELKAPMLTIFIGGNHEASNYLQELPYGGWVAPNIYYLGYAGVVRVNDIRIGGISGIYKGFDFLRGHHEYAPFTESTLKSVYHVRQLEVFRLKQLSGNIDIFMSHDWPRGIFNYGNKAQLLRFKPHFSADIESGQLGSRPCEDLLKTLQPSLWFAAHLHCKFAAVVPHESMGEDNNYDSGEEKSKRLTKFLALDKCLPKRRFLQVLDIDSAEHIDNNKLQLEYDLEWLTILCLTNHLISVKNTNSYMPGPNGGIDVERYNFTPTSKELDHVRSKIGDLKIPENFCRTAKPYDPERDRLDTYIEQPTAKINPQSSHLCDTLGIDDPLCLAMLISGHDLSHSDVLERSVESSFDFHSLEETQNVEDELNKSKKNDSPLKRKTSLIFTLPKPLNESEMPNSPKKEDHSQEVFKLLDIEKDDSEIPTNFETEVVPVSNLPTKKFKRRNIEMYTVEGS